MAKRKVKEGEVVLKLREGSGLSYRDFAKYLNEKLSPVIGGMTTGMNISNWEKGVYPVTDASLMAWRQVYPEGDPRHQLALDIYALRMASVPVRFNGLHTVSRPPIVSPLGTLKRRLRLSEKQAEECWHEKQPIQISNFTGELNKSGTYCPICDRVYTRIQSDDLDVVTKG